MLNKPLRIYDFDETIYNGNSSRDFIFYYLRRHPSSWIYVPGRIVSIILYYLGVPRKTALIEQLYKVLKNAENIERDVREFWEIYYTRIKDFYIRQMSDNDIIISGSPEFLLRPICDYMGVRLVASRFDLNGCKFVGKYCIGKEKVARLNRLGIYECDEFYTDSFVDSPMIKMAKKSFIVEGNKVSCIWSKGDNDSSKK